jgi:hypothetical protein
MRNPFKQAAGGAFVVFTIAAISPLAGQTPVAAYKAPRLASARADEKKAAAAK